MNSKTMYDTEDKIAYNFFENVMSLRENIGNDLERMKKVNANINGQISMFGMQVLDENLPDLGIALNNKLVEIYQQFKENKIEVFQRQDTNKEFLLGIVPMLVINKVIARAVDIYENEMAVYIQEAEKLKNHKEANKEKLKEKNLFIVLATVIRTVFNDELSKRFYFDESEIEDLGKKLEEYRCATESIYNYDYKKDIIDTIAEGLASQNLSLEVINAILENDVADVLEKLGISNQMLSLRYKIEQLIKSKNESKKCWELSEEEKAKVNDYDSKSEMILDVTFEEDLEK